MDNKTWATKQNAKSHMIWWFVVITMMLTLLLKATEQKHMNEWVFNVYIDIEIVSSKRELRAREREGERAISDLYFINRFFAE